MVEPEVPSAISAVRAPHDVARAPARAPGGPSSLWRIARGLVIIAIILSSLVYGKVLVDRDLYAFAVFALGGLAYFEFLRASRGIWRLLVILAPLALFAAFNGMLFRYYTPAGVYMNYKTLLGASFLPLGLATLALLVFLWIEERIVQWRKKRVSDDVPR